MHRRRGGVRGGTVVAGAESGTRPRQRAGLPGLRRGPPARRLGHPALPPPHPSSATLRDDEPRRAGEPVPPVRWAWLPLGTTTHPSADADLQARVPALRRTDDVLPPGAPPGGAAGVRAAAAA